MAERDNTDSESSEEESQSKNSTSGDEDAAISGDETVGDGIASSSEYEKQRQSRIAENRARMEALGLNKLASSLMADSSQRQSSKKKKKSKGKKVKLSDDEYRPGSEDERRSSSSSDDDKNDNEDDDDDQGVSVAKTNKRKNSSSKKVKNGASIPKKKGSVKKVSNKPEYIDDDEDLKKAIALSLKESGFSSSNGEKQDCLKNKRKKQFNSRVQMSEDELLVHFYQFDENWKGGISVRDLERIAIAHDFTWTDKELADMIRCFDSDDDGLLSIDDFRKIAIRCKMTKGSEGQ